VAGAVASPRQEEFRVVREEVVPIEGGLHHPSSQSQDGIRVLQCQAFDIAVPVVSQYDSGFFHNFRGWCVWAVVEIWGWRAWIWFVRHCGSWRPEEVWFWKGGQLHFGVSDHE
jgi:hypothetical protein